MIEVYLGAGDRQGSAVPIAIPVLTAGAYRWWREWLAGKGERRAAISRRSRPHSAAGAAADRLEIRTGPSASRAARGDGQVLEADQAVSAARVLLHIGLRMAELGAAGVVRVPAWWTRPVGAASGPCRPMIRSSDREATGAMTIGGAVPTPDSRPLQGGDQVGNDETPAAAGVSVAGGRYWD